MGNEIGRFPLAFSQLTITIVIINNPNITSVILPPGGILLNFFLVLKSTDNVFVSGIFAPHFLQTSGSLTLLSEKLFICAIIPPIYYIQIKVLAGKKNPFSRWKKRFEKPPFH